MGVDDSPTFRQLDDFFLQSQAKIWLGEVLHTRFDEQISICDLLADGELLFEVSKELWNMLLIKYMELKSYKSSMFVPVDTRKSSGRYRPYSNVDSFLKVCKVMGLRGLDLFSPSDVVEKKDTRKVCICLRSLSMKSRTKKLKVPDFDIVTNTIAMSTDAVRCIRSSLEPSSMSTVTCGQSRLTSRQKTSFASQKQDDESYLEESDEEKSHFSDTSYTDFLYLESGESPDTVDKYALTQSIRYYDASNRELDKYAHTPGSVLSPYVNSENHLDSNFCQSGLMVFDDREYPNNMGEVHRIAVSDMISFRILTNAPFHASTDSLCHSCMATESRSSDTTPNSSICRKFPNDVEALPTSRILGRVLDFDFDFDANSEPDDLTTLESSTCDKALGLCKSKDDSLDDVTDNMQQNEAGKGSNNKLADPKSINLSNEIRDCHAKDTSKAANKEHDERTRRHMAPLLKTVAKGTVLIGILFLLRLRNARGRKTFGKSTDKSSEFHWKSIDISDYLRVE